MINPTIRITAVFTIDPTPLAHYEADTVEEAAENLKRWYEDGSASLTEDFCNADNLTFKVEVVND